ncbi:MAG: LysR family transcriptional regulator, partial [Pigmentiphaga sp.]
PFPYTFPMDLKRLEYFVCVSEHGGFTRAAIELGITQPALSKQIRQLEVELRQTLFHRNGRGIALTQAGQTLFEHAKGILEQTERARQDLRELHGSPMGKVILGITPSAGKILAPNLVTEFQKRFPRASLDILEGTSSHIHDWLMVGRADIGVLYDPPDAPALNITAALHEEVCLICPAEKPVPGGKTALQYADLAHFPLILPSLPHTMRAQVEAVARQARVPLNVVLNVGGANFILELVRQGHGCTVLPEHLARESGFIEQLRVLHFSQPALTRTMVIAVSNRRPGTRLVHETEQLVRTQLRERYPHAK